MYHSSFVDRLFMGRYNAAYKCNSCNKTCFNYDPFYGISVSITASNVEKLVKNYFNPEKLGYTCEFCKKSTTATKTLKIARLPKILVLHIKRFVYKPEMQKIYKNISFPKTLDMKQ